MHALIMAALQAAKLAVAQSLCRNAFHRWCGESLVVHLQNLVKVPHAMPIRNTAQLRNIVSNNLDTSSLQGRSPSQALTATDLHQVCCCNHSTTAASAFANTAAL